MNIEFTIKKEPILLRADSQNYEICQLRSRTDFDGNVVTEWEAVKFFASLSQALNKLLDMKVRSSDATTLKQLAADIDSARIEISAKWNTEVKQ